MAPSSRPAWLVEALDVIERRGGLLRATVGGLVLLGVILAAVAPGVLPPRPLVGAAVAVAAILIGLALTITVDAGDAIIRGPRHVRAAGGELVGVLPSEVSPSASRDLAGAVLDARPGRRVVLGLTGTGRGVDAAAWTDALGVAIADRDASVLIVDVASGATPHAGLLEVIRDGASLGHTVTFERDVKLARLGAGRDLDGAIRAAAELPVRLPKDLEVLLVALPPLADGDVLAAAGALDAVLLLARSDATPRVRLQASIEALEGVGTVAQVVLIDDRRARPVSAAPAVTPSEPEDVEPAAAEADEPPAPGPDRGAEEPLPAGPAPVGDAPVVEEPTPVAEEPVSVAEDVPAADPERSPDAEPDGTAPVAEDLGGGSAPEPEGEAAADTTAGDATGDDEEPPGAEPPVRDRWSGAHTSTPRAELERRPAPSVRVVRDLPPTARGSRPVVPPLEPGGPAAPRDPDVVSGAAAADLAARLASTQRPSPATEAPEPEAAAEPEPVVDATPEPEPDPEPAADPEPTVEPEPVVDATPEPEPTVEPEPVADVASEPAPVVDLADGRDEDAEDDEVVDPTDEIPAVRDARLAQPQDEDDPLRTTAQLALLMDELHERDEDAES